MLKYNYEKPSKAVISIGRELSGTMLWWVGIHLCKEIEKTSVDLVVQDLLRTAPRNSSGIWIWEGKYDPTLIGNWREPTKAEWLSIQNRSCP